MTIEQMHEFVVLAEERNYLVAADILFTTQATLSRHIMAMEEELGFRLFSRSTKKVELTPEGNRFLLYARNAVRIQNAYKAAIKRVKEKQDGILRVGYSPLVTFYMLADHLTHFMAENSDLDVKISEGSSEELMQAVREGALEVALIQENPFEKPKNIDFIRFSTDTMAAILPKNHPLANRECLELQELKDEKFVFAPLNSEPALVKLEAMRRCGFEPNIVQSGIVGHSMYDWVAGSDCIALDWKVPALHHNNDAVSLVNVYPPLYSNSLVIYKKDLVTPAGRRLLKHFEENSTAKEMIQP
ncbi:MAG: LysR substrate-binding domain-containing protein [Lachnospiraceae bacterium]|jgi:LysR family transcriptional activator of glutamate synthase operon